MEAQEEVGRVRVVTKAPEVETRARAVTEVVVGEKAAEATDEVGEEKAVVVEAMVTVAAVTATARAAMVDWSCWYSSPGTYTRSLAAPGTSRSCSALCTCPAGTG